MKTILIIGLLTVPFLTNGQTATDPKTELTTSKFRGVYSFGTSPEKSRVGTILVYPESDSTILFYIDLNRGAPSYNLGSLYGRMKITNASATFYYKFNHTVKGCHWMVKFDEDKVSIKTVSDQYECGFGAHVYADADYTRVSDKSVEYFVDAHGTKVFFKATKPEGYYK